MRIRDCRERHYSGCRTVTKHDGHPCAMTVSQFPVLKSAADLPGSTDSRLRMLLSIYRRLHSQQVVPVLPALEIGVLVERTTNQAHVSPTCAKLFNQAIVSWLSILTDRRLFTESAVRPQMGHSTKPGGGVLMGCLIPASGCLDEIC